MYDSMKNAIALVIALVMAFAIMSCSRNDETCEDDLIMPSAEDNELVPVETSALELEFPETSLHPSVSPTPIAKPTILPTIAPTLISEPTIEPFVIDNPAKTNESFPQQELVDDPDAVVLETSQSESVIISNTSSKIEQEIIPEPTAIPTPAPLPIIRNGCIITQYGDWTGSQSMFYTIESINGELIVVDGGWVGNTGHVRQVIASKGNRVTSWILTHPHPDHIGAFNAIYSDPQGLIIDKVYATDVNYELYKSRAKYWDDFSVFEEFLSLTRDAGIVQYLYEGDRFEIDGLHFNVLHAFSNYVSDNSSDLANDGSLVFKVTYKQESMLFCADVGVRMSSKLIGGYGAELKCDYIQMSHHGNGGFSEEFYRLTSPRIAFFDAPEWLMNPVDPNSTWTTPKNRRLMQDMGASIYYYATVQNSIELK